uniref:Auxin efflux carrier component n=1 Tax=Kalanchoe fedtschenkoi TaxID=63787 RepID=A0A7N0VH40_KALFE
MGKSGLSGAVVYNVLTAIVPLYAALFAAYGSVRWWKIFDPVQGSGISAYVSYWVVPFLMFKFIAESDPYTINFRFIAADTLQKVVVLVLIFVWQGLSRRPDARDWGITFFSLATLPNTLIVGIPLFTAFYGDEAAQLMVQIVFFQSLVWFNVSLIMFEYRAAVLLIAEQFPTTAGRIASVRVDPGIASLSEQEHLDAVSEVDGAGRVHVSFRRRSSSAFHDLPLFSATASKRSDLSGVEIYSTDSFRMGSRIGRVSSASPDNIHDNLHHTGGPTSTFISPDFDLGGGHGQTASLKKSSSGVHMFLWSSTSPHPDTDAQNHFKEHKSASGHHDKQSTPEVPPPSLDSSYKNGSWVEKEGSDVEEYRRVMSRGGAKKEDPPQSAKMPSRTVMMKLTMTMVWRNLSKNPTMYSCVIAFAWALIANSRLHIKLPALVVGCYQIIAGGGIGMAMFSLGIFMGLQPKLIACSKRMAAISTVIRFIISPALIAVTSLPFGLRGDIYRVAILQAALPQGILTFVFAKQYNVHPDILSTAVIFQMLASLPVSLVYFVILGLFK